MFKRLVDSICGSTDGYSLGEPWRISEGYLGVVVPVLRESQQERKYKLLIEEDRVKIEDTGQIDGIFLKNNSDNPILVHLGSIFKGKTQERASVHDTLVMPNEGKKIAVRCVHATRGIQPGANIKYYSTAPSMIYDHFSSQQNTWSSVSAYSNTYFTQTIGAQVPTQNTDVFHYSDDLSKTLDSVSDVIREALKKMPENPTQIGAIVLKENTLQAFDIFDLPLSWSALRKDIAEKEGLTIIQKDENQVFSFNPAKVHPLISTGLAGNWISNPIYKREAFSVFEVSGEKLKGEFSVFHDEIIHATLWAK